MDELKQHLDFIKANPFEFAVNRHGFTEEEVTFIEKYGHWLNALVKKKLDPISEEQMQFVEEMNSQILWRECLTQASLWKRYLRREIEEKVGRDVLKNPPPTIKDDPLGSREDFKAMRRAQFKTISEQHRR